MTMKILRGLACLGLATAWTSASAYEVITHKWMTGHAYQRSILADGSGFLESIGAEDPAVPGSNYPDSHNDKHSIPDLVEFGACEEDSGFRSLNHFFDFQHNGRALSILGIQLGAPSPVWALEDPDQFGSQHNSLRDANDYFYQAVTGDTTQRTQNFGLLFQTLGQVIHHVQDMAQPQHVRNDRHLSIANFPKPSAYETISAQTNTLSATNAQYGDDAVVDLHIFDTARKFWDGAGRGIAEFTSTNFVSKDTNFEISSSGVVTPHDGFPLPAATACPGQPLFTTTSIEELLGPAHPLQGPLTFMGTPVNDGYLAATQPDPPSLCNQRTSTLSLFDSDLHRAGKKSRFALNVFNVKAAQEFLIPRAIAYSAGMIDYFFRGRLKILSADRQGNSVQLTARNISLAEFTLADPADANQQAFEVWYDATDGTRKQAQVTSGGRVGATPLANLADQIVTFQMPRDVQTGSSTTPFVLVFRGTIGNETGVIAQVFSAAGGFLLHPNYTPDDGIAGARAIVPASSGWSLSPVPELQAGNVDWRGHQPEDVITWDGPVSRYFGVGSSPAIYSGGKLIAMAPGAVVGAAIRRNASGFRELIVAVGGLEIFVRPFRTSYPNNDLYDAGINPLGWRRIQAIEGAWPGSPLFFNASVSEAQMMLTGHERLKLTISGDAITSQRISTLGHRVEQGTSTENGSWQTTDDVCTHPDGAGECKTYISCPDYVVSCSDFEYSATENLTWSASKSTSFDHPDLAVVCVDYRGDTEVLCTVRHEAILDNLTAHETLNHQAQYTMTYQCGNDTHWSGHADSTGTVTETQLDRVVDVFQVGDVSIPIDGGVFTQSTDETTTLSGTPLLFPHVQISYSIQSSNTRYKTRILYVDARNDIVEYWSDEITRIIDASGIDTAQQAADTGDSAVRASGIDLPWVDRRTQKVIALTPERHEVLSQTTEIAGTESWSPLVVVHNTVNWLGNYKANGCNDTRTQTTPQPAQTYEEDYSNFLGYVLALPSLGVARDVSGRLAISTPVPARATWDSPDVTFPATWNFLSGGDLPTVVPTAPTNTSYGPIGLLE